MKFKESALQCACVTIFGIFCWVRFNIGRVLCVCMCLCVCVRGACEAWIVFVALPLFFFSYCVCVCECACLLNRRRVGIFRCGLFIAQGKNNSNNNSKTKKKLHVLALATTPFSRHFPLSLSRYATNAKRASGRESEIDRFVSSSDFCCCCCVSFSFSLFRVGFFRLGFFLFLCRLRCWIFPLCLYNFNQKRSSKAASVCVCVCVWVSVCVCVRKKLERFE